MSQIFLYRKGEETPFSKPIKRSLIRDKRLSFGARGVFIFLWDFPSGWSFYMSHLVQFSPGGITQLRGYLRELKNIGALEITPRRISKAEIKEINKTEKKYKAGQVLGQKWSLIHPDKWAIEAPLSLKPPCRFSASRTSSEAENPDDENPDPKGFKYEGVPIIKKQLQEAEAQYTERKYNFPALLNLQERKIATSLLLKTDAITAQQVLDVLSEKLEKNKIRGAPLAYLYTLVERSNNGQFFSKKGITATVTHTQHPKEFRDKTPKSPREADRTAIEAHLKKMFQKIGKSRDFG